MLDQPTREKIAADLLDVYRTREPLPLLTRTYPDIEVEDAYRIQEAFVARRLAAGARIKGYKVGLTSKPMQEMAGSTEPDFSAVTDDLLHPEGTPLAAAELFSPLVEIEIAFVMKERLEGPGIGPEDVIRATDFVLPSIEVVDFRVGPAPGMTITDTVADLAACGRVVLGATRQRLNDLDISAVTGQLVRNGEVIDKGSASAVLGNPVNAVVWLANKLAQFGVSFAPGHVVMTGSFLRAYPIAAGDHITARFDSGLGDVSLTLE